MIDTYKARIEGLASSLEVVADVPLEWNDKIEFNVAEDATLLVAVSSLPNGAPLPRPDMTFVLGSPDHSFGQERIDNQDFFADQDAGLYILNQPPTGDWALIIASFGQLPFAINAMAFNRQVDANGLLLALPPGTPPFKCRACKTIAKALALAIVVAATFPAIPQALITAVSTYLGGVSAAAAGAFIASVIGDTADVIAEKLCKMIGLC